MRRIKSLPVQFVKKEGERVVYQFVDHPSCFVVTTCDDILRDPHLDEIQGLPLNERIKARRDFLGLTQRDLAAVADVTQAAISIIESGESSMNLSMKEKLQKALKVDELFFSP